MKVCNKERYHVLDCSDFRYLQKEKMTRGKEGKGGCDANKRLPRDHEEMG